MTNVALQGREMQLRAMRDRLRAEIQDRVETVPEYLHATGDVTDLPTHRADHDAEGIDQEIGTGRVQTQTLADVDAALKRIENGTYGECISCGVPIAEERLDALPFTALCIDCEHERETSET